MLPPGHVAAGYLVGRVLLNFLPSGLSVNEQSQIIWWTMFFSFAPDIDMFFSFFRERKFIIQDTKGNNHRQYYSHAPILWLVLALCIFIATDSTYVKYFSLALLFGSFSHFILDSIEYGIMWLWPINKKVYAFKKLSESTPNLKTTFLSYWWNFVKAYTRKITFYFEIIIILLAIFINLNF
jgi:membrane-bound metal-dependent hydrolase YbcI (DUF457 family)